MFSFMISTALKQLKQERNSLQHRVEQLDTAITALEGTIVRRVKPVAKARKRRKMSAAARAAIGAAKKAWWAKRRAGRK